MYKAGYKTLQLIAKAKAEEMIEKIEHLPKRVVTQIISAAKVCKLSRHMKKVLSDTGIPLVNF